MPTAFERFLETHRLSWPALQLLASRIVIVGLWNPNGTKQPTIHYFSSAPEADRERAREAVGAATQGAIGFPEFIDLVKPALLERVEEVDAGDSSPRLHRPILLAPADVPSAEGWGPRAFSEAEHPVTTESFLLWHVLRDTPHRVFLPLAPPSAHQIPLDPKLLDNQGVEQAGRAVFEQLESHLRAYSSFAGRMPSLVECFQRMLAALGGRAGWPFPAMPVGYALPGGLSQLLIELLFHDDFAPRVTPALLRERLNFDTTTPDGARPWERCGKPEGEPQLIALSEALNMFVAVGLDLPAPALSRARGAHDLRTAAAAALGIRVNQEVPALVNGLRAARRSKRATSQILRSQILLCYLLSWVIGEAYQLPQVEGAADQERAESLTRLALGPGIKDEATDTWILAPAIQRLGRAEMNQLEADWSANRAAVVAAIVGEEVDIPPHLAHLVARLRSDQKVRELLGLLAGADSDKAAERNRRRRDFVAALDMTIRMQVMPYLVRSPQFDQTSAMDERDSALRSVLLSAILLDQSNRSELKDIAEAHEQEFAAEVVGEGGRRKKGSGADVVEERLLESVLKWLASDSQREGLNLYIEACRSLSVCRTFGVVQTPLPWFDPANRNVKVAVSTTPVGKATLAQARPPSAQELAQKSATKAVVGATRSAVAVATQGLAAANGAVPTDAPGGTGAAAPDVPATALGSSGDDARDPAAEPPPTDTKSSQEDAPDSSFYLPDPTVDVEELMALFSARDGAAKEQERTQTDLGVGRKLGEHERTLAKALHYIYQRYQDTGVPAEFKARVHRLTLADTMVRMKDELGFGNATSYLFRVALDLFEAKAVQEGSAASGGGQTNVVRSLLSLFSLTRYFLNSDLDLSRNAGGIDTLYTNIKQAAAASMTSTRRYLEELAGLAYLFNTLSGTKAEVIVFNGTLESFADWARGIVDGGNHVGWRPEDFRADNPPQRPMLPGLIYVSDASFPGEASETLQTFQFKVGRIRELLDPEQSPDAWRGRAGSLFPIPPILVSTNLDPSNQTAQALSGSMITAVGPGLSLSKSDSGPNFLPAGYIAASLLVGGRSNETQLVPRRGYAVQPNGRHHPVYSNGSLEATSARLLWGAEGGHPLAVDQFLHLLLLMRAVARVRADGNPILAWKDIKNAFTWRPGQPAPTHRDWTNRDQPIHLGTALLTKDASRFAIDGNTPSGEEPAVVYVGRHALGLNIDARDVVQFSDLVWFHNAVKALAL